MSPVPFRSLFNPAKELANVPVELLYSRRKLFEKIVANIARRKIQNQVAATGDRMTATPQQFGMQIAQQMKKQALYDTFTTGTTALGGGLGAVTAPAGHRVEGTARGAVKGLAGGIGAETGLLGGTLLAALAMAPRLRGRLPRGISIAPELANRMAAKGVKPLRRDMNAMNRENLQRMMAHVGKSTLVGGIPGAALGGYSGASLADAALGKPSWTAQK